MKNTFVITIEEEVADFLDRKTQGGNANTYLNEILEREMKRQQREQASSQRNGEESFPQDLQELMKQTPDAAR